MHEIFAEDAMANETNLKDLLKDPSLLATQGYLAGEWVEFQQLPTLKPRCGSPAIP